MTDVVLKVAEEHVGKTKEELSTLFDQEVERFSAFMSTVGDWKSAGPLNQLEKHLIKTYLVQKFTGKVDGAL